MCESDFGIVIGGGQVLLYFQFKVDVQIGIFKGVEVLVCWIYFECGMILLDCFILLVEQCGLIYDFIISMMDQFMVQVVVWYSWGLVIKVVVNFLLLLLEQLDFLYCILELVDKYVLLVENVVLEIIESLVVVYKGNLLGMLVWLCLKGFGLLIDDYGIGFLLMQ